MKLEKAKMTRRTWSQPGAKPSLPAIPIDCLGVGARIPAGVLDLIAPVLSYTVARTRSGGHVQPIQDVPYYLVDSDGSVLTAVGLVPRVVAQLQQHGYVVEVRGQATVFGYPHLNRDFLHDPQLPEGDRDFLKAMYGQPRGQVVYQCELDGGRWLAQLCCLYAGARILVVTPSLKRARSWHKRLLSFLPGHVMLNLGMQWDVRAPILVATSKTFSCCISDDWDVIVFVDPPQVLSQPVLERAGLMRRQLRFCFRSDAVQLDAYDQLRLEFLCGPEVFRQRADLRDVQVLVATPPSHPRPAISDPLVRKQQRIWNDPTRNDCVAQIATAFVDEDLPALWQHGLLLEADEQWFERQLNRLSVAILVESQEHGRQLLRRLLDWELRHANSVYPTGGLIDVSWGMPAGNRTIITMAKAQQVSIEADVLIRADGGPSPWNDQWGPGRPSPSRPATMYVVDLCDDFDSQAATDLQARLHNYRHRKWQLDVCHSSRLHTIGKPST